MFVMLHRLEGILPQCCVAQQGGEGGGSHVTNNEPPKAPMKKYIKKEPKRKGKADRRRSYNQ